MGSWVPCIFWSLALHACVMWSPHLFVCETMGFDFRSRHGMMSEVQTVCEPEYDVAQPEFYRTGPTCGTRGK